jgi:hypothetical protein
MVALPFGKVQLPFGSGLAEHLGPAVVPAGKAFKAENCIIDKAGTFQLRRGFQEMPLTVADTDGTTPSDIASVKRLIGFDRETLVHDGTDLYSYSEELSKWVKKDKTYEATIKEWISGERGRDTVAVNGDCCLARLGSGSQYYAHAWTDGTTAYLRVTDATTGVRYPVYSWAMSGGEIRVVNAATATNGSPEVAVVYHDGTTTSIKALRINVTSLESSLQSPTISTVASGVDASGIFDCKAIVASGVHAGHVVAYNNNVGTITVTKLNTSWTGIGSASISAQSSRCIAVDADTSNDIYVVYTAASGASPDGVCFFSLVWQTLATVISPTQIDSDAYDGGTAIRAVDVMIDPDDKTEALCAFEKRKSTSAAALVWFKARKLQPSGSGLGKGCHTHRIGMLSRLMHRNSTWYIIGYYHERSHQHLDASYDPTAWYRAFGYLLEIPLTTVTVPT